MASPIRYFIAVALLATSSLSISRGLHDLPPGAIIVGGPPRGADVAGAQAQVGTARPHDVVTAAAALKAQAAKRALGAGALEAALAALDVRGDPLEYELAAAELIDHLQSGPDSHSARAALDALSAAPLRVFRRHEETAADWFVPLIDVPGRAKFALRMLDAQASRSRWQATLVQDPAAALLLLAGSGADEQSAAVSAVAMLSAEDAQALFVLATSTPLALPSSLWRSLAERLATPAALAAASTQCSDSDLLLLLPVLTALDDAVAARWLVDLVQRPELASAALLALAPRAPDGSAALARLQSAMDDATLGPSAAAALAQRPQVDRLAVIGRLISNDASPLRLQHVALALRLEGSKEADTTLDRLRDHASLPAAARQELWR